MSSTKVTLSDGTVLRTSSNRRYVVFGITDDSRVEVYKRTDDWFKATKLAAEARRHFCRVVTVDTGQIGWTAPPAQGGVYGRLPASVAQDLTA